MSSTTYARTTTAAVRLPWWAWIWWFQGLAIAAGVLWPLAVVVASAPAPGSHPQVAAAAPGDHDRLERVERDVAELRLALGVDQARREAMAAAVVKIEALPERVASLEATRARTDFWWTVLVGPVVATLVVNGAQWWRTRERKEG